MEHVAEATGGASIDPSSVAGGLVDGTISAMGLEGLGWVAVWSGLPLPAVAAVAMVLMATIAFWVLAHLGILVGLNPYKRGGLGGSGADRRRVLLCGACGAGKTQLFLTLRDGTTHGGSVTSMAENEARVDVEGKLGKKGIVRKAVNVVDLPGHPRLRAKLDHYVAGARGVIFVVDAVEFTAQRRAVAEQLFDVLSHPTLQRRRVPVLLACNKSEKITAHPVEFIRKRLQKEIELLRATAGTLEDTAGASGKGSGAVIGKDGEEFQFEHLAKTKVDAVGISVADDDLDAVKQFIVRVA